MPGHATCVVQAQGPARCASAHACTCMRLGCQSHGLVHSPSPSRGRWRIFSHSSQPQHCLCACSIISALLVRMQHYLSTACAHAAFISASLVRMQHSPLQNRPRSTAAAWAQPQVTPLAPAPLSTLTLPAWLACAQGVPGACAQRPDGMRGTGCASLRLHTAPPSAPCQRCRQPCTRQDARAAGCALPATTHHARQQRSPERSPRHCPPPAPPSAAATGSLQGQAQPRSSCGCGSGAGTVRCTWAACPASGAAGNGRQGRRQCSHSHSCRLRQRGQLCCWSWCCGGARSACRR